MYMCVCVRERERERERQTDRQADRETIIQSLGFCFRSCVLWLERFPEKFSFPVTFYFSVTPLAICATIITRDKTVPRTTGGHSRSVNSTLPTPNWLCNLCQVTPSLWSSFLSKTKHVDTQSPFLSHTEACFLCVIHFHLP
jgi:hypothetical protein